MKKILLMKSVKSNVNFKETRSNTSLRENGNELMLMEKIKERQTKYYDHIKRHDTLINTMLEREVKGR